MGIRVLAALLAITVLLIYNSALYTTVAGPRSATYFCNYVHLEHNDGPLRHKRQFRVGPSLAVQTLALQLACIAAALGAFGALIAPRSFLLSVPTLFALALALLATLTVFGFGTFSHSLSYAVFPTTRQWSITPMCFLAGALCGVVVLGATLSDWASRLQRRTNSYGNTF